MLTMLEDDDSLFAAMCAGARGYMLKGADTAEVLRTVRAVAAGEALFGPAIAERLTHFFSAPTTRVSSATPVRGADGARTRGAGPHLQGEGQRAIAARLFVSTKTVSNHISNIFAKLHVVERAQAIVKAREGGLGRRDLAD